MPDNLSSSTPPSRIEPWVLESMDGTSKLVFLSPEGLAPSESGAYEVRLVMPGLDASVLAFDTLGELSVLAQLPDDPARALDQAHGTWHWQSFEGEIRLSLREPPAMRRAHVNLDVTLASTHDETTQWSLTTTFLLESDAWPAIAREARAFVGRWKAGRAEKETDST